MPRTAIFVALIAGVTGFSGCMHEPRLVTEGAGGYVAIPENSNSWPYHYRDEAFKKIREKYAQFNPASDIVTERDVPVEAPAPGAPVNSVKMEHQIVWRINPAFINNGPLNTPVVPAGGLPRNLNGQPGPVGGPAYNLNQPAPTNPMPIGMRNGFDPGMSPPNTGGQPPYPGNSYTSPQTAYPQGLGPTTGFGNNR
jgi:hypothetical protein